MREMTQLELEKYVIESGTWNTGCGIQQRPKEVSEFIIAHLPRTSQYRNFLEIGCAIGGTARLLNDFFMFDNLHFVDDNGDGKGCLWAHFQKLGINVTDKRRENIQQAVGWIGDSTSDECFAAVKEWDIAFDLIHIDGGHVYRAVKSDTYLGLSVASPKATIFFHDALIDTDIPRWMQELKDGKIDGLEYKTTYGDDLGIAVFEWNAK